MNNVCSGIVSNIEYLYIEQNQKKSTKPPINEGGGNEGDKPIIPPPIDCIIPEQNDRNDINKFANIIKAKIKGLPTIEDMCSSKPICRK